MVYTPLGAVSIFTALGSANRSSVSRSSTTGQPGYPQWVAARNVCPAAVAVLPAEYVRK